MNFSLFGTCFQVPCELLQGTLLNQVSLRKSVVPENVHTPTIERIVKGR